MVSSMMVTFPIKSVSFSVRRCHIEINKNGIKKVVDTASDNSRIIVVAERGKGGFKMDSPGKIREFYFSNSKIYFKSVLKFQELRTRYKSINDENFGEGFCIGKDCRTVFMVKIKSNAGDISECVSELLKLSVLFS